MTSCIWTARFGVVLVGILATAAPASGGELQQRRGAPAAKPSISVWKTATCGCCGLWVEHMRQSGFDAAVVDVPDLEPIKQKLGVPPRLASCHTALVNGFVVEGHIPADAVRRLLKERPAVAGIAVPGMPIGSPGMEVPGGHKQPYAIVAFDKQGKQSLFERR
jgi:hypothetical protein